MQNGAPKPLAGAAPALEGTEGGGRGLTGILLGYFMRISATSCILEAAEGKRRK